MNIGITQRESVLVTINRDALENNKSKLSAQPQAPETTILEALTVEDKVDISADAKNKTDDFQKKLDDMRNEMQTLREGLRRVSEAGSSAAKAWKERIKCLKIAMRIMSGDIVPEEDYRYLRERDMELYSRAIQMRIEKEDPKEYDRLSEDEDKNNNNTTNNSKNTAPAIDTAKPAETNTPPPDLSRYKE